MISNVDNGNNGFQRFVTNGNRYLAVGVYIAEFDSLYFEAFPLENTERTLQAIATALGIGAAATALVAGFLGWWTNRRLLRPLTRVAKAAGDIASGGLDTRMPTESDPDLDRLARSFNEMADAVQTRLEREARFASDVSHELRSPITALAAAVEVLDARRTDLPDRTQQALDVVVTQVRRFDQMVMDLLELSRIDAGSTELHREDVPIEDLVSRIAHRYGFGDVPIVVSSKVPTNSPRRQVALRTRAGQPAREREPARGRTDAHGHRASADVMASPWPSRTRVPVWRRANGRASSNASREAARRVTASAPASGCRSSPSTRRPTAATHGSRTARAAEHVSS